MSTVYPPPPDARPVSAEIGVGDRVRLRGSLVELRVVEVLRTEQGVWCGAWRAGQVEVTWRRAGEWLRV